MPTTYYIEVRADQQPIHYGVDSNNRVLFSLNFSLRAIAPAREIEEDMLDILLDASLPLELGVNTFISEAAVIPNGNGPYITILIPGGIVPEEHHGGTILLRPAVQVIVRGTDYDAARALANDIWGNLHGKRNIEIER